MNTFFRRILSILMYAVFLFLPLAQIYAQAPPLPATQNQQETMENTLLKKTADTLRQDTTLSEEEKAYMFRFSMRKMMQEKMRRSGQSMWGWEPTAWQKTLPPIMVQEKGTNKSYSFTDLIEADGYLCLGSARAYKALQVALPILYKDSTPVKGDFKITHGPALCTSLVYDFFMEGYTDKAFLELDSSLKEKLISIERLSTGKKVTIVFPPSTIRGHDKVAAEAGDVILHAQDGQGMTISVQES